MNRNKVQFVIPAGGLGSRFADFGYKIPKPLILIHGIPMLAWVIANLNAKSQDEIFIVTRKELELEDGLTNFLSNFPVKINYVYLDEVTRGPAITVDRCRNKLNLDLPLVVANSDQFVPGGLTNFNSTLRSFDISVASILTMISTEDKWSYVAKNEYGDVVNVVEKEVISNEATVGIYGWSRAHLFFSSLDLMIKNGETTNGEFYVAPTFNQLCKDRIKINTLNVGEDGVGMFGLGTVPDLLNFLKTPSIELYRKQVAALLNYDDNQKME